MSDTLPNDDKNQATARADQFQHALTLGGVTDLTAFLDGLAGADRLALLTELVTRELRHRWAKGEHPRLEEYIARYPELAPGGQVPVALIVEEHRCRLQAGESPDRLEYRERFPDQFDAFQIELNSAVMSGTVRASGAPQMPPTAHGLVEVAQQYELVKELGRGMFGEVWLARKKPSGIERAIKILLQAADRDAGQRELKSLELIKNLRHPYLLATEDFWITGNRLHIVMELAEGTLRGLLRQHLSEGKPGVPIDALFRYIAEAAEGLDFLHSQNIIHRDVKPDNILILHGHTKVADFGLARAQSQVVESMSLAGTPAYMAPEIWGGEGGAASDLYSLAFAYVELRQGRSPLKPCPLVELMIAHQEGRFEFTDTVTERERDVLRRALAAKPHERYRSCTDFVADLAFALEMPFAGVARRAGGFSPPAPVAGYASAGAFASGSLPVPVDTGADGGTAIIDSLPRLPRPKPEPEPDPEWAEPLTEPTTRRAWPLIIAGTLGLVALVAFGAWILFGGSRGTPTEKAEVLPTKATREPQPDETGEKPKPPGPVPKQPDPIPKPKSEPKWVFPKGTAPETDTPAVELVGRTVPEWVSAEHNGEKMRFRLITGQPGPAVPPFYISETKVTNRQFGKDDGVPVVGVTALAAQTFARNAFNGDLPSADEWDHAAGFHDQKDRAGPTLPSGIAWCDKAKPGVVRRPEPDKNQFGLLDMAGNGREWTRTILTRSGEKKVLGLDALAETDKVILRGRNFIHDRPLTYKMLEIERTTQPQAAPANVPSPYTGFRVVLKAP